MIIVSMCTTTRKGAATAIRTIFVVIPMIQRVVPDQLIPIEGAGFTEEYYYYLTMRGNTKYHEYEGLSTVVLSGYFQVN